MEGDAFFNPNDDGGRGMGLLTVTIKNSPEPSLKEKLFDMDTFHAGLDAPRSSLFSSGKMDENG